MFKSVQIKRGSIWQTYILKVEFFLFPYICALSTQHYANLNVFPIQQHILALMTIF